MSRIPLHPGRTVCGAVLALAIAGSPPLVLAAAAADGVEVPVVSPPAAVAEPRPSRVEPPAPRRSPVPLSFASLVQAWQAPADGLDARIERVRGAANALGIGDVEPLARALLIDPSLGSLRERADAAVRLAPGLPAAEPRTGSRRVDGRRRDRLGGSCRASGALRIARSPRQPALARSDAAHAAVRRRARCGSRVDRRARPAGLAARRP
ncbi:MAG: hypothetical protein M5U32_09835 [Myxococcota bacterium]|nr:hypothetical protein [Myxococcota bacterium]